MPILHIRFVIQTHSMKKLLLLINFVSLSIIGFSQPKQNDKIISIHLLNYTDDDALELLSSQLDGLQEVGIDHIFLEVDYHFEFTSHPELINPTFITKVGAQKFAKDCKAHGINIIPQFQSLGHQSWAENTWELLTVYPELDLTPGAFPNNKDIYCREWDPMNPRVNQIVFPMIEEILDAFDADGLHIGMDEVFLITSEFATSTKDQNPAEVYAKVVNEFHDHFTKKLNKKLYMWGDRLIDGTVYNYGEWESSFNGTAPAIDFIPNDIVICDWHYESMLSYASVKLFIDKGFEVLPCSWKNSEAAEELIKYSYAFNEKKMVGHMFTTWGAVPDDSLLQFESMNKGIARINSGEFYDPIISLKEVVKNQVVLDISERDTQYDIYYTLDGTTPNNATSLKYNTKLTLKESCTVKAILSHKGIQMGEVVARSFVHHKGLGAKVQVSPPASDKYPATFGNQALVNGVEGSLSFMDGEWLGFDGKDVVLVIDLGKVQRISRVSFSSHNATDSWIFHPTNITYSESKDGNKYNYLKSIEVGDSKDALVKVAVQFNETKTRFLKIEIDKRIIPSGFEGEGNGAWLFIDEVIID